MNSSVVSRLLTAAGLLLVSSGTLLAQFQISASPSTVVFDFAPGSTGPVERTLTISAPVSTGLFQIAPAGNNSNLLTVSPNTGTLNAAGQTVTVRINNPSALPSGSYSASLTVTSFSPGVSPLSVPVVINVGTSSGGGTNTAYPATIALNYTPGSTTAISQTISVTGSAYGTYSVALESTGGSNIGSYATLSSTSVTTGSYVTMTFNPQFAPANVILQGNVRFTPLFAGTGVTSLVVPVTLSPYGTTGNVITASPSTVSFNYASGTTGAISQSVNLTAPYSVTLTPSFPNSNLGSYLTIPQSISSNGVFQITLQNPSSIFSAQSGTLVLTPTTTTGNLQQLSIPITINPGNTTSALSISPSPISLSFPTGSTQQVSQSVTVSGASNLALTASISGLSNLVTVPSTVYTNTPFSITVLSPNLVTSAVNGTLTVTPPAGSGLASATATIQLLPGGSTGTGLTASPTSLTFNSGTATTQYVQLSAPLFTNVTITPSYNIASYFTYPSSATTGQSIGFTLINASSVPPNTTGSFTISASNNQYPSITIPVSINTGTTGSGTITVNPTSATFSMQLGGAAPQEQVIALTEPNGFPTTITLNVTSENSFLQVGQSSGNLPSNLTLRIDPSNIREARTYSGNITVVRLSDQSVLANIPVTLNVIQPIRVTTNPATVSLSSVAGSTTAATASVQVNSTSTSQFLTTVSTVSGGSWLSVTPTTASNFGSSITINANPSGLAAGTYQGTVSVTVGGAPTANIGVTFVVAPASALQLGSSSLSFNYQVGSSSNPPSQSVTVAGTTSGVALNYSATATSTGNWLSVSPSGGTTPGSVSVSVNPSGLTAGTYNGTVQIASSTATNSPQTVNVTLTVTAPALPTITSVVSAASFAPTLVTPGGILTIRGTNLGPATGVSGTVTGGRVDTTAGGVTVTFDGVPAPMLYASATQINVVAPYEVASRATTRVVITYNGQASQSTELRVTDTAPALFTAGGTQAAALNQNGSFNGTATPESRGNIIVLYATGEGTLNPVATTGQVINDALHRPTAAVSVRIGGQPAEILYAGSMPGAVAGALQINVRIPQNIAAGQQSVDLQVGSASTQSTVTIAVQ